MRSARAPKGFRTVVDIKVTLKGARRYEGSWETPIAVKPAYHKAVSWIDQDLLGRGIKGRTTVQRIQVDVRYEEGEFTDDKS